MFYECFYIEPCKPVPAHVSCVTRSDLECSALSQSGASTGTGWPIRDEDRDPDLGCHHWPLPRCGELRPPSSSCHKSNNKSSWYFEDHSILAALRHIHRKSLTFWVSQVLQFANLFADTDLKPWPPHLVPASDYEHFSKKYRYYNSWWFSINAGKRYKYFVWRLNMCVLFRSNHGENK